MLDCAITGGVVIDGTGRPGIRADVGIHDGRIVAVGKLEESARQVIDAEGRAVAPGFIDVHTHYDAQVMWDPQVSPSSLHGVTTVVGGNCGFTIAPASDDSADYVMHMLACVEGMPAAALESVLDFRWKTFADWLRLLEGRLAVNAGFLVGHSTVRKLVMGSAWQESPTEDQLQQMVQIVDESIQGGALGFSSSWGDNHRDHLGNPVPSRHASKEELVALASVLRNHPGTMLEFIPPSVPIWPDYAVEAMTNMSVGAQRPLNWNLLTIGLGLDPASIDARLAVADQAAKLGGRIVALSVPMAIHARINLMTTIGFNMLPVWPDVLALPFEERLQALVDPPTRQRLAAAVDERRRVRSSPGLEFEAMTVGSVVSPTLKSLEGRRLGDIAHERGVSGLDAFLDIAVDDRLQACFQTSPAGDDHDSWQQRAKRWQDPRVLVGGSDAGAHLDSLATFAFFTDFVGPTVRERGLLTLEDAVQKVTDAPAQLYGLHDRGRLLPGFSADVVVFDPETVRNGDVELRNDLPNDEYRLFAEAVGVDHVLVNGVEIVDHGKPTGSTPGTLISAPGENRHQAP
jgi:N-acyl-D-aspartate/D-glutamate deacylase